MEEIKKKEHIKICGISIWRILAYFVVYSVAGFIIETSFVVVSSCKLLCQVAPSVQQWTCNGIHQDHGLPTISRRDQDHSR